MNYQLSHKNAIILSTLLFAGSLYSQAVDEQSMARVNGHNESTIALSSQQADQILAQIEAMLQSINKETLRIESCLSQIEQMLHANKIKLNDKATKAEILKEIKLIRLMIQAEFKQFSNALNLEDGIIQMALLNRTLLHYLLPIIQTDIADLNAEELQVELAHKGQDITEDMSLRTILQENAENIEILVSATDVVGLTSFNKFYRALQDKTLPVIGGSFASNITHTAYAATIGALAYGIGVYATPTNTIIPGINFNTNSLPGKAFLGDALTGLKLLTGSITQEESQNLGVVDQTFKLKLFTENPALAYGLSALAYAVQAPCKLAAQSCKQWAAELNNYLRGDIITKDKKTNQEHRIEFSDIVGGEHLKQLAYELADFIKHPTRYQRTNTCPSTGFLLAGPPQTGKTHFVHALQTLINDQCAETGTRCKIEYITQETIALLDKVAADKFTGKSGYDLIFEHAQANAPYILFFDELDMFEVNRNKNNKATGTLLTNMTKIHEDKTKPVIVIGATNRVETLDEALLQNGRFGKIINFTYPNLQDRQTYLHKIINKENIQISAEYVDIIAQETTNCSFNTLTELVKAAVRRAKYEGRPATQNDFEFALDREVRKIIPQTTMSPQEAEIIAIYQAGQAVARHILQTEQQVLKITIDSVEKSIRFKDGYAMRTTDSKDSSDNHELLPLSRPNPLRLGQVFTLSKRNGSELVSNKNQENELLALLAGQAALELIAGEQYDQLGKEDRALIIQTLEKKISQGAYISDAMRQQAIAQKDALFAKIKMILQSHVGFIKTVVDLLVKNHTINKEEWSALVANYII